MRDGRDGRVSGVRKVAVLRANALGDMVVALPALAALRRTYPRAEIVLLGRPWHRDLWAGRPGPVDRVEVVPPHEGLIPGEVDAAATLGFVNRMRAERFDVAIQLHGGGGTSNPLVASLGARLTAGARAPGAPPLDRTIPYWYHHAEVLRHLEVVGLVGARTDRVAPALCVTVRDRAEAEAALSGLGRPLVVLHPGATDPRRRWPAERFAEVGAALAAEGAALAVIGDAGEAALGAEVAGGARGKGVVRDLTGRLGLGGLVGVLSAADLVIANDSGPRHVAEAVGTATVGVYWCGNLVNAGPMTRARHRPLVAWTTRCPVCGAGCTGDDVAIGATSPRCEHSPSFVASVQACQVLACARELLGLSPERAA